MLRDKITGKFKKQSIDERFWSRVNKGKENECWEWTGGTIPNGYGMVWMGKNNKGAHRVSWELHFGKIPRGMYVCHHCDNPICVNPNHLFLGEAKDNTRDKIKKGRQPIGEGVGSAKITKADVLEIRRLYATGEHSQQQIAKRFGIKRRQISHIVRREQWKHV